MDLLMNPETQAMMSKLITEANWLADEYEKALTNINLLQTENKALKSALAQLQQEKVNATYTNTNTVER